MRETPKVYGTKEFLRKNSSGLVNCLGYSKNS